MSRITIASIPRTIGDRPSIDKTELHIRGFSHELGKGLLPCENTN